MAPFLAFLASAAIVAANWTSRPCDVYLASQFFECQPRGIIDDLGHALILLATIPLAVTLSHSFLPQITAWITRFAVVVVTVLAGLHLLLALGVLDHTAAVPALLMAWGLFGLWLIAERGFPPRVAVFAGGLGVTMVVWALAFQAGVSNDAMRVAGGGLFVFGYPFWLAYATWGRRRGLGIERRPGPLVRTARLVAAGLATLVLVIPGLLLWAGATIGLTIGDPAFFLTVTNATDVPVLVQGGFLSGGQSSLEPGATGQVSWGAYGRFVATTVDRTPIYCRDISTYDRLRMRARVTVTRDPTSCGP